MGNSGYTIRNFLPSDFDAFVRLISEVEQLQPTGRDVSPQVIREDLYLPGHLPEKNLFLAEIADRLVGYLDILLELEIGRLVLDALIHPAHRRRGLFSGLLAHATERGKELGTKVAHIRVNESNEIARIVLLRLGFRLVRRFLELSLDLTEVLPRATNATTLELRHLGVGEVAGLCQLQNECFSGTWGFNPNTVEEVNYRLGSSYASFADVILACVGGKPVGYCWMKIVGARGRGQIFMLGVCPAYRGRGLGKELLIAGISHLKNRGLKVAELTVDEGNKVALLLYYSLGFRQKTVTLWYEKEVA